MKIALVAALLLAQSASRAQFEVASLKANTRGGGTTRKPASDVELQAMLAPLLEERFHLAFHRETRVLPVYILVQAKGGAKVKEGDGAVFRSDTAIFGALEDQRGLKLNGDRAPIDMLVIDHADRVPTDD